MSNRVLIVVPIFNESYQVVDTLNTLEKNLPEIEFLLINDGSTDDTEVFILPFAKRSQAFHYLKHESNRGYGEACRTGVTWASNNNFDWVVFIDSDLTNPIAEIQKIIGLIEPKYDLIKGNRYSSLSSTSEVELYRRVISIFFSFFCRICFRFKVLDAANGFRAIKVSKYQLLPLIGRDFSLITEEVYWQLKQEWNILNFETTLGRRSDEKRKSAFSYSISKIWLASRWPLKYLIGK